MQRFRRMYDMEVQRIEQNDYAVAELIHAGIFKEKSNCRYCNLPSKLDSAERTFTLTNITCSVEIFAFLVKVLTIFL